MNRRQLAFIISVNALISLLIAIGVTWAVESRRPDPEELAALYTPPPLSSGPAAAQVLPTWTNPAPAATPMVVTPAAVNTSTPPAQEIYTVQAGDSLLGIALRYNVSMADLMATNQLSNPDFVFVGQRLLIPPAAASSAAAAGGGEPGAATPVGSVQISAVESPGILAGEAILIANESDSAFNLQGWSVSREGGPAYTFANLPLFPGGSVRLHTTGGVDSSVDLYWGQPAPIWTTGTTVRLLSPAGALIDSYRVP